MKTADLIPFILLELKESDKYGLEITKNIESKSNGLVVIKQPTLYTVLKKLEKSKFISSYWEDSEIGGKRHYYKLTENGKLQVSTLPTYQDLLRNLAEDEESVIEEKPESLPKEDSHVSIMDALLDAPTPIETILPTEEVFADNSIDSATELEINTNNAEVLKSETEQKHEEFADNSQVAKFTEQTKVEIPQDIKSKLQESQEKIEILHVPTSFSTRTTTEQVKYVEYADIKSSSKYKKARKTTKNMLLRTVCSSLYLIITVILSSLAVAKTGSSPLYNVFMIAGIVGAIFYPLSFIFIMEKFRFKVFDNEYKNNLKLNFFVSVGIFLFVLVLCVFVNIFIGNGSILKLFAISNFANFYGPLFISTSVFVDYLLNYIFMKKLLK